MTPPAAGSPRGPRRPRAGAGPGRAARTTADASGVQPGGAETSGIETTSAERPTGLRLARVHLQMGLLQLARAELESFAGRGVLDEDALLDLAEARWRTGDLAGAGEAAVALLDRGREDVLALVIAAEATAELGRPGEARRLAGRALTAVEGPLDALFAGMPRSPIWPLDAVPGPGPVPEAVHEAVPHHPGRHRSPVPVMAADEDAPASPAAAEAFAGGLAALGSGDLVAAALRLGVALRLEPGFAEGVLEAIGERPSESGLALVAGDALRLLGREAEALAAFDVARGHGTAEPPPADETGTPRGRPDGS